MVHLGGGVTRGEGGQSQLDVTVGASDVIMHKKLGNEVKRGLRIVLAEGHLWVEGVTVPGNVGP